MTEAIEVVAAVVLSALTAVVVTVKVTITAVALAIN